MIVFSDELIAEYKQYTGKSTAEIIEIIKKLKCSPKKAIDYYSEVGRFPSEAIQEAANKLSNDEFRTILTFAK